jgi:hypothetical protein
MINVADLLRDPDFAQTFQVIRSTGYFGNEGEYIQTQAAPVNMVGVIQPAKQQDMVRFLPEGERLGNQIVIYCDQEIKSSDATSKESDIIIWRGGKYRVGQAKRWLDHGYWQVWAEGIQNA